MGVGAGLYMYDVVVKSSRSLSHLLMSFFLPVSGSERDGISDSTVSTFQRFTRLYISVGQPDRHMDIRPHRSTIGRCGCCGLCYTDGVGWSVSRSFCL